jgi:hypothetical protein
VGPPPLKFGVYPLGLTGGPDGVVTGRPDDIGRIGEALGALAGDGPPLLVRMYVTFGGSLETALGQAAQFAQIGSLVDLCLSYHDPDGDVGRWCSFVDQVVRRHGCDVGSIGVTNEANLLGIPFAPDGAYPGALAALADGMQVAAQAKSSTNATAALGFTTASDLTAAAGDFWRQVMQRGGEAFSSAADFAGLTMYPGGFGPQVPTAAGLAQETAAMLTGYRAQLSAAGIPAAVPIRVAECGWPTGPGRSEQDQAGALEAIVGTVDGLRGELGITHWELFTLRDADSNRDDVFSQFGVLRDDYSAKAAFEVLRRLISQAA